MYLRNKEVSGKLYWSVVEPYRDNGLIKQRVIESLGNTENAFAVLSRRGNCDDLVKKIEFHLPAPSKSPLIWFGGKGKTAKHILKHMPVHTCYVEPFGGAAHVIAQKSPVYAEVYNDIDGDLVNFLMIARDHARELYRRRFGEGSLRGAGHYDLQEWNRNRRGCKGQIMKKSL